MAKTVIAAVVLCALSFVAGILIHKYRTDAFLMWGLYMDSSTSIQQNLAVLNKLREGDTAEAIEYLEQFMQIDMIVLRGCDADYCDSDILASAEAYLARYRKE